LGAGIVPQKTRPSGVGEHVVESGFALVGDLVVHVPTNFPSHHALIAPAP
jgi:hypothetical protein